MRTGVAVLPAWSAVSTGQGVVHPFLQTSIPLLLLLPPQSFLDDSVPSLQCQWYGCELAVADRWYPSSKTCSGCGAVNQELSLSERTYRCQSCEVVLDRDLNAAINLAGWAHPAVTASAAETLTACGADRKTGPGPAGGWEAGAGIVPEPTGSTGGPHPRDPFVTI